MASRDRILLALTILFGGLAIGGFFWAFKLSDANTQLTGRAERAEADAIAAREEMKETVAKLEMENIRTLGQAEERFSKEQGELRSEYSKRMTDAYNEFSNVVANGQQALGYIDTLEEKIKNGQNLDQSEIDRLTAMASGIDMLRKRYEAPMQDFKELGDYFSGQASVNVQRPDPRLKRLKRLFNRDYRDEEFAYQKAVGQQAAFAQANARYQAAYKSARTKMATAASSMDAHAQRLAALTAEKAQNHAELEQFFRESRTAIQIHLDVIDLDFEPQVIDPSGS